ncbi:hypothetical protein CDCA_CDCA06G1831 [Cyanidium caldarium]|uniref:Ubiquinol-cytochrome c chaperone domain-containing protein n=1 Tax=Cyanidium caldarium TaxID=2771 RepID=A0AAV9IUG8_CYACA|nr:hypothetical protein CDCA_CDCA06G1831 [Cyanidium caldarium]
MLARVWRLALGNGESARSVWWRRADLGRRGRWPSSLTLTACQHQTRPVHQTAGTSASANAARTTANHGPHPPSGLLGSFLTRWLRLDANDGRRPWLLRVLGFYTAESQILHTAKMLYIDCEAQVQRMCREVYRSAAEPPAAQLRFAQWYPLVTLHLWMTLQRLRAEGARGREISEMVYQNFWEDVERRMMLTEGLTLLQTSKWKRECEKMFYGSAMRYDEAWLNRDAPAFQSALRRNVPHLDERGAQRLYQYVEQQVPRLGQAPVERLWSDEQR